jgi:signal transduction histidine kinase
MIHALRWRIPVFVCVLILGILVTFLLATHHEIERTLIGAGRDRAQSRVQEFTDIFARALGANLEESRKLAAAPAVRAFVTEPTELTRTAALNTVAPAASGTFRRIEIWTAEGTRILEVSTPGTTASGTTVVFPAGPRPTTTGVSPLRTDGELAYFDITAEIRDADAVGRPLGYLRRYGRVSLSGNFKQLFGANAVVRVGSAGESWADLTNPAAAASAPVPDGTLGEHRDAEGQRWVGYGLPIDGTPWIAWVGFTYAEVVAPAQPFMRQMYLLAGLFLVVGTVVVGVVSVGLSRRVGGVTGAAREIADGNYSRRVPTGRPDEIGRLAQAFNTMAGHVERAHQALRASHEQTHFALASARIGIWESHVASGEMTCSDSVAETRGLTPGSGPRSIEQFLAPVHEEDREALERILRGHFSNSSDVFQVSYRLHQPDGTTLFALAKGRLQRNATGEPVSVLGVGMDVTEQRRLETQLRQAQKIEALGQLAGGVAHDFNNLLTAIIGHGSFLLHELRPDDRLRQDAGEILAAAERAAALTRQLLAFSRRQVLQPQVIAINAVVANVHTLIRRLIGEQIEIRVSLTASPDAAKLDPGQLEQVLLNLAVNARDAMPDGGTLTIATSRVALGEEYAQQHASVTPGQYIMVAVSDTGIGMDAETQSRLFEPFFTTKPAGHGTGLGLATVYGIVKQSGGFIYPYSELGRGSTFKIYFPATEEVPAGAKPAPPAEPSGGKETILVVDDNPHVQTIASRVLTGLGYTVFTASSGEDALQLVSDGRPIDLVVSDVIMPGMTGPELCRQLLARYPGLRVLFTSGYSGDAISRHGVLEPGMLFIEKPYSPSALGRKVREALGQVEPVST